MFIPLKDLNPHRSYPFVNIAIILANVAVFFYELSLPPHALQHFMAANSTVPAHFSDWLSGHGSLESASVALLASMFLHANLLHLAGNMLFLWIFGDNVEDFYGHFGYLFFYLVCGTAAGLLHTAFNWNSSMPALGASGAISGVMGAYLILYPRARILTLVFIFFVPIPAMFILLYWFALQFLSGLGSLGAVGPQQGGVAWWAHVGGFLTGILLTGLARRRGFGRI